MSAEEEVTLQRTLGQIEGSLKSLHEKIDTLTQADLPTRVALLERESKNRSRSWRDWMSALPGAAALLVEALSGLHLGGGKP